MYSFAAQICSRVIGCKTRSRVNRPTILSWRASRISSPSLIAEYAIPLMVLQSSSFITTSCAISTRRRVRYPAFAVFSAVSARPFRAPFVEIKNSITDKPSLKFARIGSSIISPLGFAIRPRIPESCRIWFLLPRAPETAII